MSEHVIAWLFATMLLILLAASGTTHWLIAHRGATPTLANLRARVHAWWWMSAVLAAAFTVGRGGTVFLFWLVSFFALREFLSLVYSRRSDYRVMVLCYYFILPLQYVLVYAGNLGLFATFIPVYAFLFMPIAASLSGDSRFFLARAATAQWAVMISVYCISHIPALLNLRIPGYDHNILLLLFLVGAVLVARKVGFPSFVGPWDAFFSRPHALAFLLLIVLYKLGDAFAASLSTSFLLRGVGFSQAEIGAINKGFGLLATIVGALLGGAWLSSRSLYQSLMLFGILQAFSNVGYWLLSVLPKSYLLMAGAIGIENLCGGLGTAAFVAFLMALTDRRFSAAQYALLSALAAIGRVYVGPVAGVVVEQQGWPTFFLLTVAAAVPGLLMLWWLRREVGALDAQRDRSAVLADAD